MRTEQREIFITDDGQEFTNKQEAVAYIAKLENEILLDSFLASLEDKTEQAKARMKNDIVKFLAFQMQQEVDSEEGSTEEGISPEATEATEYTQVA